VLKVNSNLSLSYRKEDRHWISLFSERGSEALGGNLRG